MNIIIANFLILLNLMFFVNSILKVRIKNKLIITGWLIFGVFLLSNNNYTNEALLGTFIMELYYTIYIFLFFNGSIYRKLFILILFVLTVSFSELFVANCMNFLVGLIASQINDFAYMLALVLSNVLTFFILLVISKFMKKYRVDDYSKFMWVSLILPLTTLLLLFNFTDYFSTFRNNLLTLFVVLGLFVSNIIALLAVTRELKRLELSNEIKKNKMQYDLLNSQYNANFAFLHDTIRRLTILSNCMDEDNFTDYQKEILDLNHSLMKSLNMISSSFKLLNSLLNQRITDIDKHNISIKTIIEYDDFGFLNLEDRMFLFSELVTKSIDSCINLNKESTRVILKTKKTEQQVTIQCTFSYEESYNLDFEELYQTIEKCDGHISQKVIKDQGLKYFDLFIVFFAEDK